MIFGPRITEVVLIEGYKYIQSWSPDTVELHLVERGPPTKVRPGLQTGPVRWLPPVLPEKWFKTLSALCYNKEQNPGTSGVLKVLKFCVKELHILDRINMTPQDIFCYDVELNTWMIFALYTLSTISVPL